MENSMAGFKYGFSFKSIKEFEEFTQAMNKVDDLTEEIRDIQSKCLHTRIRKTWWKSMLGEYSLIIKCLHCSAVLSGGFHGIGSRSPEGFESVFEKMEYGKERVEDLNVNVGDYKAVSHAIGIDHD